MSPDGLRLAVAVEAEDGSADLWITDLERDAWTRPTSSLGQGGEAEWSPDGRLLAVSKMGDALGSVKRVHADGSGSPEGPSGPRGNVRVDAWSPDGRLVVFSQQTVSGGWDIGIWPVEGGESKLWMSGPRMECCAALSPDGRWMAYVSTESGRTEVYVQPFPGLGVKQPVSTEGGMQPRWSRDGRELFYRSLGERPKLMATLVETRGGLRLGATRPLFDDLFAWRTSYFPACYDVSPDGQRFLFIEEPEAAPAPRQLVLIPNWSDELRAKLRAAHP